MSPRYKPISNDRTLLPLVGLPAALPLQSTNQPAASNTAVPSDTPLTNAQSPTPPSPPTPSPSPPSPPTPSPPSPAQPSAQPSTQPSAQPPAQPPAQPSAQPPAQPSAQSQPAPQQTAPTKSTITISVTNTSGVVTVTSTSTTFPPDPTETCVASGLGGTVTCNNPNSYCDKLSNTCNPKNSTGQPCSSGDQCISGFCSNDICVDVSSTSDENSNSNLGTKIGVVVGVIFGTAAIVGIFVCCIRLAYNRRQRKRYNYEMESDAYSDGVSVTEARRPSYPFAGGAAAFSSANPPFAARNVARSVVTDTTSDYNPRPKYNAVPAPVPPSMQYRGQGGSDVRPRDVNTSRTVQPGPLYPGPSQFTAANYQYANISSLSAPIPSQAPVAQHSYNQPPPAQPPVTGIIPKPDRVYSPRPAPALPQTDSMSANEVVNTVSNNAIRSPIVGAAIGAGVVGNNLQVPDARKSNASSDKGVQIVYRVANNKQAEEAHNRLFEAARDMNERQIGNTNNENAGAALDQTYLGIDALVPHGDFEERTGRKGGRYTMASMYTTSVYSTYSRDSSTSNFGLRPPDIKNALSMADVPDSPTLSYTGFYEANIASNKQELAQAASSNNSSEINVPINTETTTEAHRFGGGGSQTNSASFEDDLAAIHQFTLKHGL
ncbi:4096_t:CDS:1 [Paraglomus occultum]|uniref:4096_t:CDS:1 n=1 Tax=Paraglomus occultum TaxID=144539 RepID=A0A9N8Z2H2_9GLOM|nr:4096_t:CDS:1 [Paraglomus occultum]